MKATEQLRDEHEGAKLMLKILEKVVGKVKAGGDIDTQHLDQILEFIIVFIDKCHHGKEEELLFPALEEAGIPREGGPIGVMLREHDMGRGYVQGLSGAIAQFKKGDRAVASRIVEFASDFLRHLTQHIEKENQVLFPMADAYLSSDKQEELLKEFDRLECEKIGIGRHEEFHRMLHHLKDVYLG
jgi:hemerythrin-like domain-containing protein